MERKTDEFTVLTDDGQHYLIYEYTNYINVGTFEDPKAIIPDLKSLRTSNGMAVNVVGDGIYKIVPIDSIARRI